MITENDMRFLVELRVDGRRKVTDIAKKLGMPASTAYDRKRKLEGTLITKYAAIMENNATKAWLIVPKEKEQELNEIKAVNNMFRTNRGFLAEVICNGLEELENIREKLSAKEHIVISEIKKEEFWTRSEHLELAKTEKNSGCLKSG